MYSIENFERPSVASDAAVFGFDTEKAEPLRGLRQRRLKLLLVRRGEEPFCGRCSLPGGFLRHGETVEQTALRELAEETGITDPKLIQLGVYSRNGRDPRGWIISCAFLALTKTVTPQTAEQSDAAAAFWAEVSCTAENGTELLTVTDSDGSLLLRCENGRPVTDLLAFDHAQIITDGFRKLREEVVYHDLIFDLMPELFTVSDLQQPYELITGTHTSPQNFRKKMIAKLTETDYYNEAAAHRTAKLYRRKDGTP